MQKQMVGDMQMKPEKPDAQSTEKSAQDTGKKKREYSKIITTVVIIAGFLIVQECFVLMYLCINNGYTSTAAWLTAAVGLAEAVIAAGLSGYLSLAKSDHSEGGITYETAKANGFKADTSSRESPPI